MPAEVTVYTKVFLTWLNSAWTYIEVMYVLTVQEKVENSEKWSQNQAPSQAAIYAIIYQTE